MTSKAYTKVFGNVNTTATKRDSRVMRVGKTARDKAKGHVPYVKNRRIWDKQDRMWVKV